MAPVQTAVAGHASVAAFFQPRPWLVAVFLGFTIAIVAMLAAGVSRLISRRATDESSITVVGIPEASGSLGCQSCLRPGTGELNLLSRVLSKKPGITCNWLPRPQDRGPVSARGSHGKYRGICCTCEIAQRRRSADDRSHQMVLKKVLIIGLLVLGIAAAAVLLFYAGDHDDEYRNSAPPAGRPLPV